MLLTECGLDFSAWGSRDGLDVRRLQCDFARKLVPLAMQCLRGLSLGD